MTTPGPDLRRPILLALAALLIASLALHVWLLLASAGAEFDITSYRLQAFAVLHGLNVYDYTVRYPYPPVWIWIVGAAGAVSGATGLDFTIVVRVPGCLGDLALTAVLFDYRRAEVGWRWPALVPAALWALNPVPALVSAAHGQFDSLPLLFTVLAFRVRGTGQSRRPYAAALLLGVGIALKGFPFLLAPYLALTAPPGRRLVSLLLAALPVAVASALYVAVAGYSASMPLHVLGYTSTSDIGWGSLVRWSVPTDVYATAAIGGLALVTAFATLVAAPLFGPRFELAASAIFGLFFAVSALGSVQYLAWGLPFFVLALPWLAAAWSLAGTALMLGFYASRYPGVLPLHLDTGARAVVARLYDPGVIALWVTAVAVVAASIRARRRFAPRRGEQIAQPRVVLPNPSLRRPS